MDRKQINKFNMFRGVEGVTTDAKFQVAVQASPRFSSHASAFRLLIPKIQEASKVARSLTTKEITESTETIRERLAELAVTVSSGVVAYAEDSGDQETALSRHVTRSDIAYGRGNDAAEIADNLLAAALARASHLDEYGLTGEILDEFDDLIQTYSDRIGRSRATIVRRKTVRASLPALFDAADKHLAQMDRIANILKRTHPDFVAEYENHRRIIHIPGTRPGQEEAEETTETQSAATESAATESASTERTAPATPEPAQAANPPASEANPNGAGLEA